MHNTTGMPQESPTTTTASSAALGSVLGSLVIAAAFIVSVFTVATAAVFWMKRRGKDREGYVRHGMKHKPLKCIVLIQFQSGHSSD